MSSDRSSPRKKPKSYYVDYTKTRFRNGRPGFHGSSNSRYRDTPDVSFGSRGFLITSVDEVKSYLEMRNILEECYEKIYKIETKNEDTTDARVTIEDDVESELRTLRKHRPFKQTKTHCRNTLFINISSDFPQVDPVDIVDRFFEDLDAKKEIRTSNTFKVVPVVDTFRNNLSCVKEAITNQLQTAYKDVSGPKKFFIELQSRGNLKVGPEDRRRFVEGAADAITAVKPDWSVDRDTADYIVSLTILKDVCCLAFLTDYFKRCRYNVVELYKTFNPSETPVREKNECLQYPQQLQSELEACSKSTRCKDVWRRADAVCFDVDSTVCCDEAIDELAKYVNKSKEVSDITRTAMLGGTNFRDALAKRLDIIRPSREIISRFLASQRPRLTEHVEELVSKLHKLGRDVYLISGGFDVVIEPAAKILNISMDNVFANSIKFNSDGSYAGFDETRPTSSQNGKSIVISMLKQTKGYKNIVMIGDGVTDLQACPPADAFIGFGGNQVRETVRNNSDWFVYDFKELITELPYCNNNLHTLQ